MFVFFYSDENKQQPPNRVRHKKKNHLILPLTKCVKMNIVINTERYLGTLMYSQMIRNQRVTQTITSVSNHYPLLRVQPMTVHYKWEKTCYNTGHPQLRSTTHGTHHRHSKGMSVIKWHSIPVLPALWIGNPWDSLTILSVVPITIGSLNTEEHQKLVTDFNCDIQEIITKKKNNCWSNLKGGGH